MLEKENPIIWSFKGMIDAIERRTLPIEIICKIRIGEPKGIIREVNLMESLDVDELRQIIKKKSCRQTAKGNKKYSSNFGRKIIFYLIVVNTLSMKGGCV